VLILRGWMSYLPLGAEVSFQPWALRQQPIINFILQEALKIEYVML